MSNPRTTPHDRPPHRSPTIPEAAVRWDLPERYVRRLVEERRIAVRKLDRVRIVPESMEAFLAASLREPTTGPLARPGGVTP